MCNPNLFHIRNILLCFLLLSVSLMAGCNSLSQRKNVVALPNREVAALEADDVIQLMQRCGFSDKQILEYGTDLRNSLALQGAAQIHVDGQMAVFAVHASYIHVVSRNTGNFTYNYETHEFH